MGNTANAHVATEQWPTLSPEKAKEFDYILLVDQSGSNQFCLGLLTQCLI